MISGEFWRVLGCPHVRCHWKHDIVDTFTHYFCTNRHGWIIGTSFPYIRKSERWHSSPVQYIAFPPILVGYTSLYKLYYYSNLYKVWASHSSLSKIATMIACLRCILWILDVLMSEKIYSAFVKLPMCNSLVSEEIRESSDFWLIFWDCIRAIDRLHILVSVPKSMQVIFHNQKGQVSQNTLTACSMEMVFLNVLPKWEGSAADSMYLKVHVEKISGYPMGTTT